MAPPEGFEPPSDALEERCLNPLDHGGVLLFIPRLVFYPLNERQIIWCLQQDSNLQPTDYESAALTN